MDTIRVEAPAADPDAAELGERVRSGDVRALARAISLVENDAPEAESLLAECFPFTGKALRIGVTGSPGAGKSTLVDRLARHYRQQEKTVGVVAVDPTSPFSGGAILGDRIRMQELHGDPGFFVRSMATRGALGGLARTTADVLSLIEASGKDVVLIETVGVGQDEVDIVRLADITVVVLVPGMGDDVQSIKAGIMEIADIFVINKSDREGVERLEKEIRAMQGLGHGEWVAPVVRTVAYTGEGVAHLCEAVHRFDLWMSSHGRRQQRRETQWRTRIEEMMRQEMVRKLRSREIGTQLDTLAQRVAAGEENPYRALKTMMQENVLD